ncbi:MAG TPA: pyridoxal-phosphate dependent enzyme [Anaerolineae bacterium]|nr:pyridoxal-phosphate dependent enzyme [Anaerolineae bacterium]
MTTSARQQRREEIRAVLARQPRVPLGTYPTPLEPLPNLTTKLDGPRLYIKRDDMTGLALGGNKTRQLEYVLGKLMREKPDVFVTGANIQSNWCRQATAAAVKLGIPIVLVLRNTDMQELQGNALLDAWMGADIRFVNEPDMTRMGEQRAAVIAELKAEGKRVVNIDPRAPENAFGYIEMAVELDEQLEAIDIAPDYIWLAAAGPTYSGLLLGARLLGWNCQPVGVAPLTWSDSTVEDRIAYVANQAAALLELELRVTANEICILYNSIGAGYAIPSRTGLEAMQIAARTDAILLDPVYTGKAMAALIDHVRRGRLTKRDTVVFVHTGGVPASFAYQEAILAAIQ